MPAAFIARRHQLQLGPSEICVTVCVVCELCHAELLNLILAACSLVNHAAVCGHQSAWTTLPVTGTDA